MEFLRGFATTFKHVLEEPVTIQYPEQERGYKERYKGRHHLRRYENGMEKCIGCALCAANLITTRTARKRDRYILGFVAKAFDGPR